MPELPEVETTRRGIAPFLEGRRLRGIEVRQPRLRWPVPVEVLARTLPGGTVRAVERRAKYLLLRLDTGTLILHLGMSGSLRCLHEPVAPGVHDHLDLVLDNGERLRLTDPRRFGALLWTEGDPAAHPLLAALGPEPLGEGFDGDYLYSRTRGRRQAIKTLIMDSHVVVGVGNIYANEALFRAGIHPARPAGRISAARCERLAAAIRGVLAEAIELGGTTLRDFHASDGRPGYFRLQLAVYDRGAEPCRTCAGPIRVIRLGQRSTFYCPRCQR